MPSCAVAAVGPLNRTELPCSSWRRRGGRISHLDKVVPVDPATGIPSGDAIREGEVQQHRLLVQHVTLAVDVAAGEAHEDRLGERRTLVAGGYRGRVTSAAGVGMDVSDVIVVVRLLQTKPRERRFRATADATGATTGAVAGKSPGEGAVASAGATGVGAGATSPC